ncbi:MAG TPA: rhomboid family intramembrane serine protease [Sphingobacterium sp.]|nr:rhomboid family intramembrane serine protease [Sphingobacterium sp.]
MKENIFKSFLRDTYRTSSPIPFIITGQAVIFVLMHIFELLSFSEITDQTLFSSINTQLSLPPTLQVLITQPWAFITHTLIYHSIFNILFDCLWLYWVGNMFLDFLKQRQFWMVFGGGLFGGALLYVLIGQTNIDVLNQGKYWHTMSFGTAALIGSVATLLPTLEVRLFLFGNVKFRTIALVYLSLEAIFAVFSNIQALVPFIFAICYGIICIQQLKSGKDWSKIWNFGKPKRMKVIHRKERSSTTYSGTAYEAPSQEQIDQILDKISQSGYDNLTSREKEILFKASKQDQE